MKCRQCQKGKLEPVWIERGPTWREFNLTTGKIEVLGPGRTTATRTWKCDCCGKIINEKVNMKAAIQNLIDKMEAA